MGTLPSNDNPPPAITETQAGVTVTLVRDQPLTLDTTGGNTVNADAGSDVINVSGNGKSGLVEVINADFDPIHMASNTNISVVGPNNEIYVASNDQLAVTGTTGNDVEVGASATGDVINISNATIKLGGSDSNIIISGNNDTITGNSTDTITVTGTGNTISGGVVVSGSSGTSSPITVTQAGTTVSLQSGQTLTLNTTGGNTVTGPGGNKIDVSGNGGSGPADILDVSSGQITLASNSNVSLVGSGNSLSAGASTTDTITVSGNANTFTLGTNTVFTLTGASQSNVITAGGGDAIYLSTTASGPSVIGPNIVNGVGSDVVYVAANVGASPYQSPNLIDVSNSTINVGANAHVTIVGNNDTIIGSTSAIISVTGYGNTITAGVNSTVTTVLNGTGANAGTGDTVSCGAGGTINVTGNGQNGAVTTINNATNVIINLSANTSTTVNGSNFTLDGGADDTINATVNGDATIDDTGTGTNVTANETETLSTPEINIDLIDGTVTTTSGGVAIGSGSNHVTLRQLLQQLLSQPDDPDDDKGNYDNDSAPAGYTITETGTGDTLNGEPESGGSGTGAGSGSGGGGDTWGSPGDQWSYSGTLTFAGEGVPMSDIIFPVPANCPIGNSGLENGTLTNTVTSAGVGTFDYDELEELYEADVVNGYDAIMLQLQGDNLVGTFEGGSTTYTITNGKLAYIISTFNISGGNSITRTVTTATGKVWYTGTGSMAAIATALNNYYAYLNEIGGETGGGGFAGGGGGSGGSNGGGSTITGDTAHLVGGGSLSTDVPVYSVSQFDSEQATIDQAGNFVISDTPENVVSALDGLNADTNLVGVVLTNTDPLVLSAAQALNDTTALGKIVSFAQVVVADTAAAVLNNQTALAADTTVDLVTVVDSAANVVANLDALNADAQISSITLADAGTPVLTLTVEQALVDVNALNAINSAYRLAIVDTSDHVVANLDALSANTHLASITLTDGGAPVLSISIAQALADKAAVAAIQGPYSLDVTDTAANVDALTVAQISALADVGVSRVTVENSGLALSAAQTSAFATDGIVVTTSSGSVVPTLGVHSQANVSSGSVISLSSLVTISDPANVGYEQLQLWDSDGTATGGQFVISGAKQGAKQINVAAANVSNVVFDAGTWAGTDVLWARLLENGTTTAWREFTVTVPTPTVSVKSISNAAARGAINLSSLVTIADPGGVGYQTLQLWDSDGRPAGGEFLINGGVQSGGHAINVPLGANVVFDAGTSVGTDTLWAQVIQNNGTAGGWQKFTVTVPTPTVAGTSFSSVAKGQQISLSSLVTIADPGGVGYQMLQLWDSDGTAAGGEFLINGVQQTAGHAINVPAGANVVLDAGASIGTDTLWAQLIQDNGTASGWQKFTVTVPAPTLAVFSASNAVGGQQISLSSLISISDPDGVSFQTLQLWDSDGTPAGGEFFINGVAQTAGHAINVASTANVTIVFDAGTSAGTDTLWAQLIQNNGTVTGWEKFTVTVPQPSLTVYNDTRVGPGATVPLSDLVTISDPGNVGYQKLELWDSNGTVATDQFVVNGAFQTGGHEIDVSPANVAKTVFDESINGNSDTLWARLQLDNGSLTAWQEFTATDPVTVNDGATLELTQAYEGHAIFAGNTGTLQLDDAAGFTGTVAGMTGADTLDLRDIGFAPSPTLGFALDYTANAANTGGSLSVTDGKHSAQIALLGQYSAASFVASSDGHGGTLISETQPSSAPQAALTQPHAA